MRKTYFAYIRVSTKKQGNGASLAEQRSAITAFAHRNGLEITKWFSEKRTAAKAGRREFAELLRELKKGRASGVIIHKVDRSARNGRDWVEIGDLVDQGIEVRFAHDDLDIRTRGGRLTADIQAVIAADFIRNNREEVKKCMYGWLKQGYYPWPAPPGYLNQGKRRLKAVDPIRGPLVARAFELYASGYHSIETLAAEMARQGLTTRNARPLARDAISKMLRNPFYVGTIRIQKTGAIFDGRHTPIVTKKLFDKVQAVLAGRVYPRTEEREFRFRRLIRCATCPRTLTGEIQRGHTYYRCHSSTCRRVSLNETTIDDVILSKLALLEFDVREMEDVRDVVAFLIDSELRTEESRQQHIERDLAKIAERLDRLTDAMVDGLIDKETFNERKASLIEERQRRSEARSDDQPALFWTSVLDRFEQANMAQESYISGINAEKRDTLVSLGSNITMEGKSLEFAAAFPFSDIMNWRLGLNGGPSQAQVRTFPGPRGEIEGLLRSLKHPPESC
jgi:DNA invertase Pin-like site-specific DNA recombinase